MAKRDGVTGLPCRVDGCPAGAAFKGPRLCTRHYWRFRRTGTFDGRPITGVCLQCATPLHRHPSALYCSERCKTRHHRRVSDEPITCPMCGTQRVARADAVFCSRRCTAKAANLRLNYGMETDEYRAMLEVQGHSCVICKRSFGVMTPHVDHDHESGRVRGILCSPCNIGLGHFNDDTARLRAAVRYLQAQS